MRRAWGLPPNDPRLQELTDADYLRELAHMEIEVDEALDPDAADPDKRAAREAFDAELAMAAAGDFEAIGLDELPDDFTPQSVEAFLAERS